MKHLTHSVSTEPHDRLGIMALSLLLALVGSIAYVALVFAAWWFGYV
jgi:hypothetical protein